MNLCIAFDRENEALPTLPLAATGIVHWIPVDEGFERRIGWYRPTVVVLDLRRQCASAGEIVARVRYAVPSASVLVVGAARDFEAAEAAMRAGAAGYITRNENLVPALRALASDRLFISSTGAQAISRRGAGDKPRG